MGSDPVYGLGTIAYFDIGSETDQGNFGGADHWFFFGMNAPQGSKPNLDYGAMLNLDTEAPYEPGAK